MDMEIAAHDQKVRELASQSLGDVDTDDTVTRMEWSIFSGLAPGDGGDIYFFSLGKHSCDSCWEWIFGSPVVEYTTMRGV